MSNANDEQTKDKNFVNQAAQGVRDKPGIDVRWFKAVGVPFWTVGCSNWSVGVFS